MARLAMSMNRGQNFKIDRSEIHILIWALLLALPFILSDSSRGFSVASIPGWLFTGTGVIHIGIFYSNAFLLYPRLYNRRYWWIYIPISILLVMGAVRIKLFAIEQWFPEMLSNEIVHRFVLVPSLIFFFAGIIYRSLHDRLHSERMYEQILAEQRMCELRLQQAEAMLSKPAQDLFVNVEYKQVKIPIAEITYIEGLKDYIKIHLSSATRPVITRMTMKGIEARLPPGRFIRTHKSFLVSAERITCVKRGRVCIGEKEVPVSESYKKNVANIA